MLPERPLPAALGGKRGFALRLSSPEAKTHDGISPFGRRRGPARLPCPLGSALAEGSVEVDGGAYEGEVG